MGDDRETRWNSWVPIKVNISMWRVIQERIHTRERERERLSISGIEVESILCPLCTSLIETVDHVFVGCDVFRHLWIWITLRWDLELLEDWPLSPFISWSDKVSLSAARNKAFDVELVITFDLKV